MLFYEQKENFKVFSIRLRIPIDQAPTLFKKETKKRLQFFQFEFELMKNPCYFMTKRKSLKFSRFEYEFKFIRHLCSIRKKRKSIKFSQFECELMRHPRHFRKKTKSKNFLNSNSHKIRTDNAPILF